MNELAIGSCCTVVCLYLSTHFVIQLAADPDQNVKNGAELLDRLIKVGLCSLCVLGVSAMHPPPLFNILSQLWINLYTPAKTLSKKVNLLHNNKDQVSWKCVKKTNTSLDAIASSDLIHLLLQDIVTESSSFDLVAFIPLLRERIYTKNAFARQFVVSWVRYQC